MKKFSKTVFVTVLLSQPPLIGIFAFKNSKNAVKKKLIFMVPRAIFELFSNVF